MVIHFTPSKPLEYRYSMLKNNGDGGGGDDGRGDDGGGGLEVESPPSGGRGDLDHLHLGMQQLKLILVKL